MGAWGEGPFASDGGLDWLGEAVHRPIATSIKDALENFLRQKVRKIPMRALDPAKMRDYKAWRKRGRKAGRLTTFIPYKTRDRGLEKWRKEWSSFHMTVVKPGRRYMHDVAEAAAGLLDELTPYKKSYQRFVARKVGKMTACRVFRGVKKSEKGARRMAASLPVHIDIHYEAERGLLYSLAAKCIREILADEAYLSSWRSVEMKRKSLDALAKALESKMENERAEKAFHATFKGWARRRRRRSS